MSSAVFRVFQKGILIVRRVLLGIIFASASSSISGCHRPSQQPPDSRPAGATLDESLRGSGIYGKDDRHDLYAEPNPSIRLLTESTVLLARNSDLTWEANGDARLSSRTLSSARVVCRDEPFREQPTAGYCSGFLVAPDTVVTAGHCLASETDCDETAVIFGFALANEGTDIVRRPRQEVYRCSRLIHHRLTADGPDFSVIRLDRPVMNHPPLKLRLSGSPAPGDELFVIGHPMGLPAKISGGAFIRSVTKNSHLTANLDTYAGNSGSPVFRADTFEVEGILARGGVDFVFKTDERCYASARCTDTGCSGEDVTLISEVTKVLFR